MNQVDLYLSMLYIYNEIPDNILFGHREIEMNKE